MPLPRAGRGRPGCRHWAGHYLVLLRALRELPELGIELREAPRDPLNAGVQVSVLAVLGVEVVFVALPLLRGGDGGVFSGEMEERGRRGLGGCSREPGSVHSHVASPAQEAALTPSSWAIRNTHTVMGSSQRTRVHTHRSTHTAMGSMLPRLTCRAGGRGAEARGVLTASSRASPRSTWGHLSCCRSRLNLQRENVSPESIPGVSVMRSTEG